jgi:hypothetical protein
MFIYLMYFSSIYSPVINIRYVSVFMISRCFCFTLFLLFSLFPGIQGVALTLLTITSVYVALNKCVSVRVLNCVSRDCQRQKAFFFAAITKPDLRFILSPVSLYFLNGFFYLWLDTEKIVRMYAICECCTVAD